MGQDGFIEIWDTSRWLRSFSKFVGESVWSLCLSADGYTLAAGTQSGGFCIYKCSSRPFLRCIRCLDVGTVNSIVSVGPAFIFATSSGVVYEYSLADARAMVLWTQTNPSVKGGEDHEWMRFDVYAVIAVPLH